MTPAITPETPRAVLVRLRSFDERVEAELTEQGPRAKLELRVAGGPLAARDLRQGVDLELFEGGERYAAEDVRIEGLDETGTVLWVAGPVVFEHVRRRSSYREKVELRVCVRTADGDGVLGEGRTVDAGGGGLSFESRRPIPVLAGDPIRLELQLGPELAPLRAKASVAWIETRRSGRTSVGVAFDLVEGTGLDRLHRLLFERQRLRHAASARSA